MGRGQKKLHEAFEVLVEVEKDCNDAARMAKELRSGILTKRLSEQEQLDMCNRISEVLEK